VRIVTAAALSIIVVVNLAAQNRGGASTAPAQAGPGAVGSSGDQSVQTFEGRNAFPTRPPGDPAAIARGKNLYDTNCSFCHGEDARGGAEGGPNLIRSDTLLTDQNGEVLARVVQNGRTDRGMPKFTLSSADVSDIAAFIHNYGISSRDPGRMRPPNIIVGEAKAGEAFFKAKCSTCHAVTGDLKGIATRISDPRTLQQTWLMPVVYGGRGGGIVSGAINVPPVTVTVTLPDGQKVDGRLGRIDDFIATLTQADGTARSFRRDGNIPKVEVHDPLQPHKDLLRVYSDKDIHDVTAYLVTIR
jgi:cytochrome c oxidase cbb3-type subunit 3